MQYNDNYCYCGSKRNKRGVDVIVYHPEKSDSEFGCAKDEKSLLFSSSYKSSLAKMMKGHSHNIPVIH